MASKSNYSSIPNDDPERPFGVYQKPTNKKRLHIIVGAAIIGITGAIVVISTVLLGSRADPVPKKNVIMMISDGFGPASETFARQYYQWLEHKEYKSILPLDEIIVGQSRTQSSSSLVTDSAAGATAFSCAKKSYNGAIGVDPNESPCGTVLESAKLHKNMLTGLVVTSRVTHATPAAFSAHVLDRDNENLIAVQQIGHNPLGRTVDLMFGGGTCEFTKNSSAGSCRFDDRDLFAEAKKQFGWSVVLDKPEYEALQTEDVELPLMALFAPGHMSFEMDRDPRQQPALHQMVTKALDILKTKSDEQDTGFFLMIEGSRIDMAAHNNDPAAHFHDILEYHRTVELVKKFVDENPNTVVISTSDHETGGFTTGRQVGEDYPEYKWNPEVVHRVRNSSESLANAWAASTNVRSQGYLKKVLIQSGLGIQDATPQEIEKITNWKSSGKTVEELSWLFSDMVSRRALLGWSTHGHTAVDVNLYAKGDGTEVLRGSHENTDIGDFMVDFLGLKLDELTHKLANCSTGPPAADLTSLGNSKAAVYHG
ncbi:alkaline-phosphatase-like protein [Parasitella parasitica]|nr:alkaline-phosphatase-like protein [Parasitella parasitica]